MDIGSLAGLDLVLLVAVALLAGALDASVGSGGAVLLPALIAASPAGASAGVPLVVNKAVPVVGNVIAAFRYRGAGRQRLGIRLLAALVGSALAGVLIGVWIATRVDVALLTWLAAIALSVLVVALLRPRWHRPRPGSIPRRPRQTVVPFAVAGIAVYDGMIGPATGSLLQLTLQRLLVRPAHECLALARLVQAFLNLTAATALWIVAAPDPWLILLLALSHATGAAVGATVTPRISAAVLHYALVACIAFSVVRMLVAHWADVFPVARAVMASCG